MTVHSQLHRSQSALDWLASDSLKDLYSFQNSSQPCRNDVYRADWSYVANEGSIYSKHCELNKIGNMQSFKGRMHSVQLVVGKCSCAFSITNFLKLSLDFLREVWLRCAFIFSPLIIFRRLKHPKQTSALGLQGLSKLKLSFLYYHLTLH